MTNITQSPEWTIRNLLRSREKAVLATIMHDSGGDPYTSLVLTACSPQGRPLTYTSDIAEHTRNLRQNPRASMLFENTSGLKDPLSGPRVSLQGSFHEVHDPLLKERFFRRHDQARHYTNAHGFFLFEMDIDRAHLVAGFGQIYRLLGEQILWTDTGTDSIASHEDSIVKHMNEDHQEALDLLADFHLKQPGEGWIMTGIDPEGIDLRLHDRVVRLNFDEPIHRSEDARSVLIQLVKEARSLSQVHTATLS